MRESNRKTQGFRMAPPQDLQQKTRNATSVAMPQS